MLSTTPTPGPIRGLALLLLLLVLVSPAGAQFRQEIVNDDLTGEENRQDPAMISLDDGGFLVFWADNSRAQEDILVRRFDAALQATEPPATVNDDEGIRRQFDVTTSAAQAGRAVAAWLDERESVVTVVAQLFRTTDGQRVGGNRILTADRALGLRDAPAAATSGFGTSLVCWEEGTFARRRIRCRLLDAEGNLPGGPIEVAEENPTRVQRCPAVAALPDGRWIVAWFETNELVLEVRVRLLAEDGTPLGATTLAHTEPLSDPVQGPEPALLVRSEDILLVWVDNSEGTGDLYGRRLDFSGGLAGEPSLMRAASDPSRDGRPRMYRAPDGRFALTWFGGEVDRTFPHLRLYGADGEPDGGDLALADREIGVVARFGTALPAPDGGWFLVWSDDRVQCLQIYMRKVAADGTAAGPTMPVWSLPASASQLLPDLAMLPDGRALVTWGDLRNGVFNVFTRLLDANGVPVGQSFQVNTLPLVKRFSGPLDLYTFWPLRPLVAASAAGRFVITWAAVPGGGAQILLGQLLDFDGQPVGANFPIRESGSLRAAGSNPRPAMAPNGSFVIVWDESSGGTSDAAVVMQRYSAQGTPLGAPFTPTDSVGVWANQVTPAVAISPFGDMVVAWIDRRRGSWDIYRTRLDQMGRPIEPLNVRLNPDDDPGNDQVNPSIATNGAAIVTVWEDNPLTAGLIQGRLEILETAAAAGAPRSHSDRRSPGRAGAPIDFTVNLFDHPSGTKNPRVAMDEQGRFVVSWWDERDGQRRVWARRYNADGSPRGQAYSIIGGETRDMRILTAVAANEEAIQFVWSDSRRGRGWDIYSRRVDWDYGGETTPVLIEAAEAISQADGLQVRFRVPHGVTGGLFRAWRDPTAGSQTLAPSAEAVLLSPDWLAASSDGVIEFLDRDPPRGEAVRYLLEMKSGASSDFIGLLEASWDPPALAWSAGPNPSRGAVWFRPPLAGPARVEIYSPAGRRVRLVDRLDGTAPVEWDGRDGTGQPVASGIYLARVSGGGAAAGTIRIARLR